MIKHYTNYDIFDKAISLAKENSDISNYKENNYCGLYVFPDTHRFMLMRVLEGYNEEYEKEEGKYLIEEKEIDKYDLLEKYEEKEDIKLNIKNRRDRDIALDELTDDTVLTLILEFDYELENDNVMECDSLEEAINRINNGYGIIKWGNYR